MAVIASQAMAGTADTMTYWLETRLADTPAGFLREQVGAADDGVQRTEIESKVVLNRMGSKVEIRSLSVYVENADGTLRSVDAEVGSSVDSTRVTAEVIDGTLRQRSQAGGRDYETVTPLEVPLLGPQGIRERSRSLHEPGDRLEYATFAGEFATMTTVEREATGRETLRIDGREIATVVVREVVALMPVPSTLWLDGEGRTVRARQESPFGLVESERSDADVQQRVAEGAELLDESYQNAVAKSNIRLSQPRSIDTVRLRIDLERADSSMPALDGPEQTVIERGERHAVLEIRRGAVPAAGAASEHDAGEAYVQANAYLQSDHPEVLALARSLRRDGLDDYAQARVLQDWVSTSMDFDAGIALVSASEAVRDRRGTCLAYAVVLTSLARALEIPSRVVLGYIYAANMWGGHAWTEVLVDGRWVALDAAVWRAGPADAARIGVIRTSLENGSASGLAELAQLYGNERIAVQSYTLNGRTVTVPASAENHAVDGRDYRNAWLGLAVQAPAGFEFAEVDIMYPRSDVLVLRNAAGDEVVLAQRSLQVDEVAASDPAAEVLRGRGFEVDAKQSDLAVSGRPVTLGTKAGEIAAVWLDDSDVWLLSGRGDGATAAVHALLDGGLRLDAAPTASVSPVSATTSTP